MPKYKNSKRGFTQKSDGTWRVRLTHNGKNYEKSCRTQTEGDKWRRNLFSDLERSPEEISYSRGKWVVKIESDRTPFVKSFKDLDQAIAWYRENRLSVFDGTYKSSVQGNVKLCDFVTTWRRTKVRATERSMLRYETSLNCHILPYLGEMSIRSITSTDVRDWVADLVEAGVSPSSTQKAVSLLKQIMKLAFNDELIRRNPVTDVELPSVIKTEQRALTVDELAQLAELCPNHKAFILLMGLMGLRIGEACALKVKNVDLKKMEIHVREGMTIDASYRRIQSVTKTKASRSIRIPQVLVPYLKPLVEGFDGNDFVFKGVKGYAINDSWFRKAIFSPATRTLGWTDVTVHNLRHTCASLLISQGNAVTTVSKILGHSTVVQTLNTYGHYYENDIRDSMESINELFESRRGSKGVYVKPSEPTNVYRVIDFKKKTGIARKLTVGPDGLEPSTHGLKEPEPKE